MFAVIAGLVWYRVDQHITTSGEVTYLFVLVIVNYEERAKISQLNAFF